MYNLTIETEYALNCDESCIDYIFILPGTGNCKIDFKTAETKLLGTFLFSI